MTNFISATATRWRKQKLRIADMRRGETSKYLRGVDLVAILIDVELEIHLGGLQLLDITENHAP